MTVASILKVKGRDVFTARPTQTMMDALHILAKRHVGALVISDDEMKVLGILSERDIIRAISAKGPGVLDEPVSNHMTQKVVTVTESTPLLAVMELMTRNRFRHVPVVDGDRCVAVVSIVDIVKQRVRDVEFEYEAMHSYIAGSA